MIYAVMPKEDYEHACDVLREYTGESELIKSGELETNIDKVYNAGAAAGEEKGYSSGYISGHADGVADGLAKTNSATLVPGKAPEGEKFWAGGKEQTGTVKVAIGGITQIVTPAVGYNNGEECVALNYTPTERLFLDPAQGSIVMKAEYSSFGNASKADVKKGKTFTSAAGLVQIGTGDFAADTQELEITPKAEAQVIEPEGSYYFSKVKVKPIPYKEEANKGGIKIIIG